MLIIVGDTALLAEAVLRAEFFNKPKSSGNSIVPKMYIEVSLDDGKVTVDIRDRQEFVDFVERVNAYHKMCLESVFNNTNSVKIGE